MKTTFTKKTANFGCYSKSQVEAGRLKEKFSIADVLNADVRLKDKAWFIRHNCDFTTDEYRQFAIGCALCVLPIYETKYPGNNAPREAIEAAQKYLAGTIGLEELREKRRAAYAAAAATTYAAAAAAATAAAYAYAAYAYADDAAAAAAYAYADDADDANYQTTLLNFFKDFTSAKTVNT